ncbi:hypothetical protein [Kribbella deserti]|uniref:Uncharacterized protein n=1 Tax=Kribbella deserti TaxID=1926257 RepID=A0ABV6QF37_9ACTN
MSNKVQPTEVSNLLALRRSDRHPAWCAEHGSCNYIHMSREFAGRSADSEQTHDRPEFSWYVNAVEHTDGSRDLHVSAALFLNNDMGMDRVAGLRCSVDDAERFAWDLLNAVVLIRENQPEPSNVSSLAEMRARVGAR